MKTYRALFALATIAAATIAATPLDTASPPPVLDPAPVEESSSGGGTSCTLTQSCYVGLVPGKCAISLTTGATVCCVGCVDSSGYCRDGNQWASECGANGTACVQCAAGWSCNSIGQCATACTSPGMECTGGRFGAPGIYGNKYLGGCICCTSCFDPDSGVCVTSTDEDCGAGGVMCARCGGNIPHCVAGVCSP